MLRDILGAVTEEAVGVNISSTEAQEGDNMIIREYYFIDESSIPNDIGSFLIQDERPITAYKTIRDNAVFTNKRLIIEDKQGITGKKSERLSIPYNQIYMWSTETAGTIDLTAEVTIFTKAGAIKLNLKKDVDVSRLDRLFSEIILSK